jgi:hypothetical protein
MVHWPRRRERRKRVRAAERRSQSARRIPKDVKNPAEAGQLVLIGDNRRHNHAHVALQMFRRLRARDAFTLLGRGFMCLS